MLAVFLLVCFVGVPAALSTPVTISDCSSVMTSEGSVTSLKWPNPYSTRQGKCVIKIVAPISHTISLTLISLDTKSSPSGQCNKKSDNLVIFDGPSTKSLLYPRLVEWCGDTMPLVTRIETSMNTATIMFRTHKNKKKKHTGYKIDVKFVGDCGMSKYSNPAWLSLPSYKIIGGVPARPYEFPWMALMYWHVYDVSVCGASIINKNWIMGAGHCVDELGVSSNISGVSFHIHVYDKEDLTGVTVLTPTKIFLHPYYNRNNVMSAPDFDIALFKVPDMTFDNEVTPVCLADPKKRYEDRKAAVIGWGRNDVYNGAVSVLPYYTTVRVTSHKDCTSAFLSSVINQNMMCSSDNQGNTVRDTCQGDSGGPMVVQEPDNRFHAIGITSWGIGCASGNPGVSTRVAHFMNWIQDTIDTN